MVQSAAKKRASPGADVGKNPLAAVELSDEDAKKLQEVQKDIARVELVLGKLLFYLPKIFHGWDGIRTPCPANFGARLREETGGCEIHYKVLARSAPEPQHVLFLRTT